MKVKVLIKLIFLLSFYLTLSIVDAQIMVPKLEWAKSSGSGSLNDGYAVGVDNDGNVYTAGLFYGTVDFDPGPLVYNLSSINGRAVFISKFDANGNFIWAKHFSSPNGMYSVDMTVDRSGNVYSTGRFWGTADFDPNVGVVNLTTPASNGEDIFISKLDSAGDFQWAKRVGGVNTDYSDAITIDRFDNVYITGRFKNLVDFDPGLGTFFLSNMGVSSWWDPFFLKLDNAGNFLWAKQFGVTSNLHPESITIDSSGNVYSTGHFQGDVNFDPGAGNFTLTAYSQDIFVSKLDSNGNFIWAKNMKGYSPNHFAYDIDIDSYFNIYITGTFKDSTDFDPGIGTYYLNAERDNGYLTKLDSNGNFIWVKETLRTNLGGGGYPYSLAIDADDNVYTTGQFSGEIDFNPGVDSLLIQSEGGADIFISKLDSSGNFIWVRNIGGNMTDRANSIILDTLSNIYIAGNVQGLVDFDPGYGVFNSGGRPFVAKYSLCPESSGAMTVVSCISYTSPGGKILNSSGRYRDFLYNSVGCDSVITLDLTIIPVDISVNNNSTGTISSNASGATYVWLDCSNNNFMNPIPGDTGQSFSPNVSGYYAVVVTQNGCTDTSNCYFESGTNIPPTSIDDVNRNSGVLLYPNPSDELIKINLQKTYSDINLSLINIHGQIIMNKNYSDIREIELNIEEPNGIYFIKIRNGSDVIAKFKVVRK